MNKRSFFLLVFLLAFTPLASPAESRKMFIEPQNGFESYISAAIVKKQVPVMMIGNRDDAELLLTSSVEGQQESGASKFARCAFAWCLGINGTQTASVQLVDRKTTQVLWGYNVRKQGAKNYQSSAEAIAKHLKEYLSKHPQNP